MNHKARKKSAIYWKRFAELQAFIHHEHTDGKVRVSHIKCYNVTVIAETHYAKDDEDGISCPPTHWLWMADVALNSKFEKHIIANATYPAKEKRTGITRVLVVSDEIDNVMKRIRLHLGPGCRRRIRNYEAFDSLVSGWLENGGDQ